MTLEVTKICRTCLGLEGKLLSIYKTKGFSKIGNMSDMLTELTHIKSDKSDGFPENVCLECIREINRSYSFKLKCEHSFSILKQILENLEDTQIESQEEPKTKKQQPDTELKIINQTVLSAPHSGCIESKTETSRSNNQSKEPDVEEAGVEPEKEETMNSDSFEIMIEKMIFDDAVDCIDILKQTNERELESRKSKEVIKVKDKYSPHKMQSLLEHQAKIGDDRKVNHVNDHSKSSGSQDLKQKAIENEPNTKNDPVLESSLLNGNGEKNEYKIHLSCESVNFRSDITIRNSPKKKESSYACSICGKVFVLFSSLHNHMPIHSEERPFSCKHCGKTFRNKSTHKLHELRHNKNKPFLCEECKSSFVCLKELKTHLLVHKNEYPYVCAICSKEFRYANALKSHIRIHTGEKPYVCTHCPKKFAQLTSFTNHHDRHTDKGLTSKEINECKYCERFLNRKKQKQKKHSTY